MKRHVLLAIAVALIALIVEVPLAGGDPPQAPTITSSTPPSPGNSPTPTLNGTAVAGSVVTLYADTCPGTPDGTATADESGNFEVTPLLPVASDATTTFYVTATVLPDTSDCSAGFPYTEDSTPPGVPTINGPPDPTNSQDASFTFSAADAVTYTCTIDNPPQTDDCSGGSKDYSGLPEGQRTFTVTAKDAAGNTSQASYTWTIDLTPPIVTITQAPPRLTNQTSATFSFRSSDSSATFNCQLDQEAPTPCQSNSPPVYSVANGVHTFTVRATTGAGNSGQASYTWTVDTIPPDTTITSAPPSPSNSAQATFAFASSEAGSSFVCSLNSGGFTPCTSPETYSGLGDGSYNFRVEAVDAAGNADPSAASYTWQISGVGPPTKDLKPPANVTRLRRNVGYGRLQLRWRKPRDADFDHIAVYVSTSAKTPPRKLVYAGKAQSYTDRRFVNGQYYRYLVVSYDHAKNASGGTPALVGPSALLVAPRNGTALRKTPTFRWSGVRRASFYNIQLYTHGEKVLSTWPGKARQQLARRWWYRGHHYSLHRGVYVWYVWPGFGPRLKSRYGHLLGYASFRVR